MSDRTLGQHLASRLVEIGISHVFGVPGACQGHDTGKCLGHCQEQPVFRTPHCVVPQNSVCVVKSIAGSAIHDLDPPGLRLALYSTAKTICQTELPKVGGFSLNAPE